jgi:hypothetical protein
MNKTQRRAQITIPPVDREQPVGPLLSLNWRFQRARLLHDARRRPGRKDDFWVRSALTWLRHQDHQERWAGPAGKQEQVRTVGEAHALSVTDALPRWKLEAWLLTDASLEEVGQHCSLTPTTVETYGALFFDIRSRAKARGWVIHRVLPPGWSLLGLQPGDIASQLKLVALKGGALALEQAMHVLTLANSPLERIESDLEGLRKACSDLLCRFALLLYTLPLSAFRPPSLVILEALSRRLTDLQHALDLGSSAAERQATLRCDLADLAGQMVTLNSVIVQFAQIPFKRSA